MVMSEILGCCSSGIYSGLVALQVFPQTRLYTWLIKKAVHVRNMPLPLITSLLLFNTGLLPQPRCQCIKTVPNEIFDHRIMKIEIFQPGAYCRNTEIM